MSIIPIKVGLLEDTMINFDNIKDLDIAKSDHALLRVEFEDFVIYSYNLLNSDDEVTVINKINNFTTDEEFKKNLISHYKKKSIDRCKKIFTLFNTEYLPQEIKKVIICFQEVGPQMLIQATEYFRNYMLYDSDPDLRSTVNGLDLFDERRLILIPTGEFFRVRDSTKELKVPNIDFAFKNAVHVQLEVGNRLNINLVNIQVHPLTNDDQLIEFFDTIKDLENLIIIGDFSRPLRRNKLMKYFALHNLYYLAPDKPTTTKELPEGDNEDKSNIVDQIIYKVSSYVMNPEENNNTNNSFYEYFFGKPKAVASDASGGVSIKKRKMSSPKNMKVSKIELDKKQDQSIIDDNLDSEMDSDNGPGSEMELGKLNDIPVQNESSINPDIIPNSPKKLNTISETVANVNKNKLDDMQGGKNIYFIKY